MRIAVALFPRLTALDAIGPYEVLQRLPDASVTFVGHRKGEVRTVDASFDELPDPDVVVVPGGIGTRALLADEPILSWVRKAHETSKFTTSVCTGSMVLAAAGLLPGLEATTHWSATTELAGLGAVPASQRVVEHLDKRIITGAGVSAGIDMALRLAELLTDQTTAKAMQLMIEYDPQPPFAAGNLGGAGDEVLATVIELAKLKD
jgi:putative intracellular protease/amidase